MSVTKYPVFNYPFNNPEIAERVAMADIDRVMREPERLQNYDTYEPKFDIYDASVNALVIKDGYLVLGEFKRDGSKDILYVFCKI